MAHYVVGDALLRRPARPRSLPAHVACDGNGACHAWPLPTLAVFASCNSHACKAVASKHMYYTRHPQADPSSTPGRSKSASANTFAAAFTDHLAQRGHLLLGGHMARARKAAPGAAPSRYCVRWVAVTGRRPTAYTMRLGRWGCGRRPPTSRGGPVVRVVDWTSTIVHMKRNKTTAVSNVGRRYMLHHLAAAAAPGAVGSADGAAAAAAQQMAGEAAALLDEALADFGLLQVAMQDTLLYFRYHAVQLWY